MKLPLGGINGASLTNACQIATSIMSQYARLVPPGIWASKPYEGGPFGPIEHLIHLTLSESFFRAWVSDTGGITTDAFRVPGTMREALTQERNTRERQVGQANQSFVIAARPRFTSLDELIDQFVTSRSETLKLFAQISEARLRVTCAHPVSGLAGPLDTVCYMIFVVHVMEHAFKLHQQLVDLKVPVPSAYYPDE